MCFSAPAYLSSIVLFIIIIINFTTKSDHHQYIYKQKEEIGVNLYHIAANRIGYGTWDMIDTNMNREMAD